MKSSTKSLRRSFITGMAGLMLIPASLTLFPSGSAEARGRGVAVRGPRGGGVAAGSRGPVRAPAVRAPAYRAPVATTRGVARRTARRTTRRLTALPAGYRPYVYGGVTYYTVGGRYYEPVYQGNTVVYIEVEFDD